MRDGDETGVDADGGGQPAGALCLRYRSITSTGVVIVQGGQVHQVQGALGGHSQISQRYVSKVLLAPSPAIGFTEFKGR